MGGHRPPLQWERGRGGIASGRLLPAFLALFIACGLKAFYSTAGATGLLWILAPSSWVAKYIGGIDLVYERGAGFISHTHQFVVGPACAGVNFLVICILTLYFSFARHFPRRTRWLAGSVLIAFAATVIANGLRIFVTAHLWNSDIYAAWMTRETMHRAAGTLIYYGSLLAVYVVVESCVGKRAPKTAPLLWYVGVSLGIPLAGRLHAGGDGLFGIHAAWVLGLVLALTAVKLLPTALRDRIHWHP